MVMNFSARSIHNLLKENNKGKLFKEGSQAQHARLGVVGGAGE
jgi:hypothetical protein